MRSVRKVTGFGVLCELLAKEGEADYIIIYHDILGLYNSNLSFLQLLHF